MMLCICYEFSITKTIVMWKCGVSVNGNDKCHIFEKFGKNTIVWGVKMVCYLVERQGEWPMNRVIDNLLLILLGAVFLFQEQSMLVPVVSLLIGFITAALGIYITERKYIVAVGVGFMVLCFVLPPVTVFLPILFYFGYQHHMPWVVVCVLPYLVALSEGSFEVHEIFLWLVLSGLAVILSHRTNSLEKLQQEMIRIRDAGTELNLALREKNKDLREKQDYEIYLATLRERNRIAREIHDNVGHMLSRSILQVGALSTIYKEEPLHEQLSGINETLNQAMNSIRESVHDLHDDSIDLRQAVDEATRDMQEKYQIRIDYDMSKVVPRNVKYCFITTIKEAMSNVVKHSDANKIEIVLREHPGIYQLFIGDNGSGRKNKSEDGIGLVNMRERVEALNGTIHINDEKGFKIFISIKRE